MKLAIDVMILKLNETLRLIPESYLQVVEMFDLQL